jgi:hypothetical protein
MEGSGNKPFVKIMGEHIRHAGTSDRHMNAHIFISIIENVNALGRNQSGTVTKLARGQKMKFILGIAEKGHGV